MINQIYQLVKPKFINVKYNEENILANALCFSVFGKGTIH